MRKISKVNYNYSNNMAEHKQIRNQPMDAGQLALRCAEFFIALGQSCLEFSQKYNKEKQRKTKLIKKAQKQKTKSSKRAQGQGGEDINEEMRKKLPKKPLTAYIIYFQEKKPNFVQKYPGLNLSDLTKLIAKEWKQIDNNQRKPYLAQAHEDRKRYENEMKQFKAKYGAVAPNNQQLQQIASVLNDQIDQPQMEQQKMNDYEKKSQKIQEGQGQQNNQDSKMNEQSQNNDRGDDNEGSDNENDNQNDNQIQNQDDDKSSEK